MSDYERALAAEQRCRELAELLSEMAPARTAAELGRVNDRLVGRYVIAFGVAVAVLILSFLWHFFGALRERQQ